MKDAIEIYIKTIIATFGFIAPSMMFFLGIFAKGTSKQRKRNEEKIKELKRLILLDVPEDGNEDERIKQKELNIKRHEKQKKKAEKDNNLLNPKRQIIRIFGSLIFTTFFIVLYYIFRHPHFKHDMLVYKVIVICLSTLFYAYSLYSIGQVYLAMAELKKIEFEEEEQTRRDMERQIEIEAAQ